MEGLVLSKVCFCRKCSFTASHFYWIRGLSEQENTDLFGEAIQEHDHLWGITVWLQGDLDPRTGMVADLMEVDRELKEKVVDLFQRSCFNRAHPFFKDHQPTTEQIAVFLSEHLSFTSAQCVRIRVSEDGESLFSEWTL
jgi:6-pyruvoyltetrahydropterin/6-carboxytetrahydropterin synthase